MHKGRQKKVRFIQRMPKVVQFSPRGKAGRPDEIELKIDEFEAFKLADYQGYHQDEGAQAMGVSRASFGRILRNARKIVADALVNGKIIRIRIGDVQIGVRRKDLGSKRELNKKLSAPKEKEQQIRENIMNYLKNEPKRAQGAEIEQAQI